MKVIVLGSIAAGVSLFILLRRRKRVAPGSATVGMKPQVPTIRLPTGVRMPLLGFGTWGGGDDPNVVAAAVRTAVAVHGYRSLDCAECYKNENEIGAALAELFASKTVSRDELFITSKVWNTNHAAEHVHAACRRTLRHLGLARLDLYLVHWPFAWQYIGPDLEWGPDNSRMPVDVHGDALMANVPLQETWRAMEELVELGLVREIGVSNFNVQALTDLLTYARIRPSVNQCEIHPYNAQRGLRTFCRKNGIVLTAYSPLGRPGQRGDGPHLLQDPTVLHMARRRGLTPSTLLLRWGLQSGIAVIPKSSNSRRQAENMAAALPDAELSADEMETLDRLERAHRFCLYPTWCHGATCFA